MRKFCEVCSCPLRLRAKRKQHADDARQTDALNGLKGPGDDSLNHGYDQFTSRRTATRLSCSCTCSSTATQSPGRIARLPRTPRRSTRLRCSPAFCMQIRFWAAQLTASRDRGPCGRWGGRSSLCSPPPFDCCIVVGSRRARTTPLSSFHDVRQPIGLAADEGVASERFRVLPALSGSRPASSNPARLPHPAAASGRGRRRARCGPRR